MSEIKILIQNCPSIENIWVNKDNTIWYLYEPYVTKVVKGEIKEDLLEGFRKLTRKEILKDGIK